MFLKILGGVLLAIGLAGFGVELDSLIDGSSDSPVLGFILSGFFGGSGVALLRISARRRRRLAGTPEHALEPAIFRLAREAGGRISAGEVTASLGTPFDDAQQALQRLADRGACQVLVSEGGTTLFRFAEFEGAGAKRDLLEPPTTDDP